MRVGRALKRATHWLPGFNGRLSARPGREFYRISDGEFILNVAECLFPGRGALPQQIEHFRKILLDKPRKRDRVVREFVDAYIARQRIGDHIKFDPNVCWIMGTDQYLTPEMWQARVDQLGLTEPEVALARPALSDRTFNHTGDYVVSAIASLYKGRRFIEKFLENITSQSIFDRVELIIIDANSPEGEQEIIAEYQRYYPNIIYRRINYRINVYEAWNTAIEMARGTYITNTNIDDLRRWDLFELQARTLDNDLSIDVVYQDFFYTFDPSFSFETVGKLGFKSKLPIITANNLLMFNSPHNAPMWRRAIHGQLGLIRHVL